MIDNDLKEYLRIQFEAIMSKIDDLTKNTEKDIDRHRKDLDDLYDKDRDTKDRLGRVEQYVSNHTTYHEEKKDNKKFSVEMWVVIGIFLLQSIMTYFK